jgi:ubiquinol-cytochrome c reductase cytochrome c1 subunit
MKLTKKSLFTWVLSVAMLAGGNALAAGGGVHLEDARVDVSNTASLQRGARNFVNYCSGCHSARYVRYNRLAADLQLSEDQVTENLMFIDARIHDTMETALPAEAAKRWFGTVPPDLSLIARSRGADYLYTFLKSFYVDPSRPTGVNNLVLPGTSMPHVLWELQGLQEPVHRGEVDAEANAVHKKFEALQLTQPGKLSPEEYDQFVRDTVNFLAYIAEPIQLKRRQLGFYVLAFLGVFWLLAYFLKKEYWKDVPKN